MFIYEYLYKSLIKKWNSYMNLFYRINSYIFIYKLYNITNLYTCSCMNLYKTYFFYSYQYAAWTFVEHLISVEHPKSDVIAALHPNRLIMEWCSTENKHDCRIFVMRHMEHYKGEEMERWDCGFLPNPKSQKTQMTQLRTKYAAKLLLSVDNM